MTQNRSNRKIKRRNSIIVLLSLIGIITFTTVLFPQVRQLILNYAIQILHKEPFSYKVSLRLLLSLAWGGICFILFIDYCTFTNSGKALVQEVKQEIKCCLSEIDHKVFIKPVLLMFGIYLLGILTIIRANYLYIDDILWSITGYREWGNWSRYMVVFLSYFVQPEIRMTDISPIPQLLAILILSCSSVLLVFIFGKGKISTVGLLASIPLGLFPYFIECLSFKFMAPYLALSILVSIIPFLFIKYKKAFFFCSTVSLLILCMTYQVASGIYPMIALLLCFQDWNNRKKTNKEILSFLGIAATAFCFSMLLFRLFFMKSVESDDYYTSTEMLSISHLVPGIISNIKNYVIIIYNDLGIIWKIGIVLVLFFFVFKSIYNSAQRRILSFFVVLAVIVLSFILSYGIYILLIRPLFVPRALFGFGVFLAILCVCTVSDYKKTATIAVLALNWCLFAFAFSYGNALADQARYAEFRIGILLHDLNTINLDKDKNEMSIQLQNSIDFAPTIKNIAKHYPIIERLVPTRLGETIRFFDSRYFLYHFNYNPNVKYVDKSVIDFVPMNLPLILDSYYHTIQSDGEHILITLKH